MLKPFYDVILVGCGMSSGAFLEGLADRPDLRILLVDRGAFRDPWRDASTHHASITPDDHLLFCGEDGRVESVPRRWSRQYAGGGSLYWYGQVTRFEESDLALRALALTRNRPDLARLVDDWAVSRTALEPYYAQVDALLRPIGPPAGIGGEGRDAVCYACRRPALSSLERALLECLSSAGLHPEVGTTCLGGQAWDRAPVDPHSLQPLSGDGLLHRPSLFERTAKTIGSARNVDVIDRRVVTRVLHERGRVAGIEMRAIDAPARLETVHASRVVLGAGPIESVTLLQGSSWPDDEALLGTGFTYTTEATCYIATRIPRSRAAADDATGRFASTVVRDYYAGAGRAIKGGKVVIYDAFEFELPGRYLRDLTEDQAASAELKGHNEAHYLLKLGFKGESLPWSGKCIEAVETEDGMRRLPRVHYALHDHDRDVRDVARMAFERIARAVPGGEILVMSFPEGKGLITCHQHGGIRFGRSERTSLLDADCESWRVKGLYVADASFMPTSGATNSSCTMAANALRVAERMKQALPLAASGCAASTTQ